MPQHKFISAKEIIARTARNTGYKLPSIYIDDILEWLPEGISMMQVTRSMIKATTGNINCPGESLVSNYCTVLPCGFVSMISVTDENGFRINASSDGVNQAKSLLDARPNVFGVNPFLHQTSNGTTGTPSVTPDVNITIQGGDIVQASSALLGRYYEIKGNYVQTSFCDGFVKMAYWSLPVCKDGYPLIPDNENFKQALEWHIMRRLLGAGYEHKLFRYDFCEAQFEKYAARGMGEVSYPSEDDMQKAYYTNIRLVPPVGYADQFILSNI